MADRISIDVLTVEFYRPQRQHPWACGCHVLDHDVEVELLWHCGIGPGRWLVTGSTLECQARRRIVGGDYGPVVITVCHRQSQQRGVERGEGSRVRAVQNHMVHPSDHAADHARHGVAVRRLPGRPAALQPG